MEKALPHNESAERATLGAILLDRDAIIPVASWLDESHFYVEKHGWVYAAQVACLKRHVPPDLVNVAEELRTRGQLDQIGGVPFLVDLSNSAPTSVHVEYYAHAVWKTARNRRGIAAGGQIAALYYEEDRDSEELDQEARRLLHAAQSEQLDTDLQTIAQVVAEREAQFNKPVEPAISTGLIDLDRLLNGGYHKDDQIIIAARPGIGKSSLMGHTMRHNLFLPAPPRIHTCELEMRNLNLLDRMLASDTGLDLSLFRRNDFTDEQLVMVMEAMYRYEGVPLSLDQRMSVDIDGLWKRIELQASRVGKPDLLFVDYLQLVGGGFVKKGRSAANRQEEVAYVSARLKALARELNIPVVALAQLSREIEKRGGPPMLADLRESGAIEQNADIVILAWRPDLEEETQEERTERQRLKIPVRVELIVAKHRNGPTGAVNVLVQDWDGVWLNASDRVDQY